MIHSHSNLSLSRLCRKLLRKIFGIWKHGSKRHSFFPMISDWGLSFLSTCKHHKKLFFVLSFIKNITSVSIRGVRAEDLQLLFPIIVHMIDITLMHSVHQSLSMVPVNIILPPLLCPNRFQSRQIRSVQMIFVPLMETILFPPWSDQLRWRFYSTLRRSPARAQESESFGGCSVVTWRSVAIQIARVKIRRHQACRVQRTEFLPRSRDEGGKKLT